MTPLQWWQIGIGAALALAGLVTLFIGLRGDPARGRLRCPRCWYDLKGLDTCTPPACPECGHTARSLRHLSLRRRFRRTIAVAALTLLIGLGGIIQATIPSGEWPRFVPTPLLRLALQAAGPHSPPALGSASTRWHKARLAWTLAERLDTLDKLGQPLDSTPFGSIAGCGQESRVALSKLTNLIHADRPATRAEALRMISDSPAADPELVRSLALALADDPDLSVRLASHGSLRHLAQSHPNSASELLGGFLHDRESSVRTMAARTLGGFPQDRQRVIPLLESLSADSVAEVRSAAAGALDRLNARTDRP